MIVSDLCSVKVSEIESEIASQPESWRRAVALAASVARELPQLGDRIAVVGCGTSLYVARAYAALHESSGPGEADAFSPSEFPQRRHYERVVAISRSGTTTEVVRLLEGLPPGKRIVLTADASSPAAALGDATLVLDFADERS